MAVANKARRWKYDRMLALKLIMPEAIEAIADHPYENHSFDNEVCRFFGVAQTKQSFEALRRTANSVISEPERERSRLAAYRFPWYVLSEKLERINEGDTYEVPVSDG